MNRNASFSMCLRFVGMVLFLVVFLFTNPSEVVLWSAGAVELSFSVEAAEPGSPEALRLAALTEQVERGEVEPIVLGGRPSAVDPEPTPPGWKGTTVKLDPDATGDPEARRRFADVLEAFDPAAGSRTAHYQWLDGEPSVVQVGWAGSIAAWLPWTDGSALVVVEIVPELWSATRRFPTAFDTVTETYVFAPDGSIELVDTDASVIDPRAQGLPLP